MRFAHQKRRLLGYLAFLAPVPLPFNDVLEWPVLILYLIGVAFFLARVRQEKEGWLPTWALNVLGLAYLPFLLLELTLLRDGQIVKPLIHLLLFVLLAKLFSLGKEKDKWHAIFGIFFLFLASMGTSVHPTIVLYLAAFVALALVALTRFAWLHILAGFNNGDEENVELPTRGFQIVAVLLVFAVSVPLFAALPRVRSPYFVGGGTGTGTTIESSGFSDEVTLDSIGRTRLSREVVMRLKYDAEPPNIADQRFKAGAHYRYREGIWQRTGTEGSTVPRGRGGVFELDDREAESWVQIWLRPLPGGRLALPVETTRIQASTTALLLNPLGSVALTSTPLGRFGYRAGMVDEPVLTGWIPNPRRSDEPTLDAQGVSDAMRELAAEVAGDGTPRERAQRLESFFMSEFEYTLDFVGRATEAPLEDFLFKYRSGHCEYFASAMVLLLRSQGIPARLATGYLGAEYNPLEGYYIVRQLNAHAWVEAYLPDGGWQVFDPTPAAGRPTGGNLGLPGLLTQAYDYMIFRWDRYVMTYGLVDQVRIFFGLRQVWNRLFGGKEAEESGGGGSSSLPGANEDVEAEVVAESGVLARVLPVVLAAFAGAVFVLLWLRARRSQGSAAGTYRRLRRQLRRVGVPVKESMAPLALSEAARRRAPDAAEPVSELIALYVRESFGGAQLDAAEQRQLRDAYAESVRRLKSLPKAS